MTDTSRTERLTREGRDLSFPRVRPKDAATLIIIDRSAGAGNGAGAPKVLLGRRHDGHKFMPGRFVFPGGRIEPVDRRMPAASELAPALAARLLHNVREPSPAKARGFALAAIRETFEETGLLIGRKTDAPTRSPGGLWADFCSAGVLPDLGALHFIARAITPPGRPKRFDTRFFAVDAAAIVERRDGVVGPDSELTELVWVPMDEAVHLGLMAVTTVVLEELAGRIAAGMGHDLPAPFYRMVNGRFIHSELV